MVKFSHFFHEVCFDREFIQRSLIDQLNEFLLHTGENIEHSIAQLYAGIAHFHLQIGLEVLALPVQLLAFLGDVVEEFQELLIWCHLDWITPCIARARFILKEQTCDHFQASLLLIKDVLDYTELLFVFDFVRCAVTVMLGQKWMVNYFQMRLPFFACRQVQTVQKLKISEEVRRLKPS